MKKSGVIIATIVIFLLVGGILLVWSAHERNDVQKRVASLATFSDENFQKDVVEASKTQPVLVDFYAEWCFPCRILKPTLEEVAKDLKGRAIVGRVNVDKNLIGRKFGIKKIPAVFILRGGEIKDAFYGVVPKEMLIKALEKHGE
jgi:thioredoxin